MDPAVQQSPFLLICRVGGDPPAYSTTSGVGGRRRTDLGAPARAISACSCLLQPLRAGVRQEIRAGKEIKIMEPGRSLLKIIRIGPRHCPHPGRWWMGGWWGAGGGERGVQDVSMILPVLAGEMKSG